MSTHLQRQWDIVPMDILGTPITVIGAGAIGGWTTLSLAKMGFQDLTVIDFDTVSIENMSSQFFRFKDIGKAKVDALADLVLEFTETKIKTRNEKYAHGVFPGIVISSVDSMAVRQAIFENHVSKGYHTRAIIDPRMGAESALLYVVQPMDPRDCETYRKGLYLDADAVQERCTAKAVIYTANLLAGLTVKAVKDFLTRPDYLRTAQWDISENGLICFKQKP